MDVWLATKWWLRTEEAAEIPHRKGAGWHSLRRRFATKRKDMSLTDLAHVGGWKGTQVLSNVYMRPDWESMEAVVTGGTELHRHSS
jgi:hypothetical protein